MTSLNNFPDQKSLCAVVLLAAGKSRRMGRPKLMMEYHGKTFLNHAVEAIRASGMEDAVVVTGYEHLVLENELKKLKMDFVYNDKWEDGMSSSVRSGLNYVRTKWLEKEYVILMVADQPYISGKILQQLLDKAIDSGKLMVASVYSGAVGTPALFHREMFGSLEELSGDQGAKKVIIENESDTATVDFPAGSVDIDTPSDYEKLIDEQINPVK